MQSETPLATIFDVWVTYDTNRGRPHYPCYKTEDEKMGSALNRNEAEYIINEVLNTDLFLYDKRIHSFRVKEHRLGCYAPTYDTESEYLYDKDGNLIDKREYPKIKGLFEGRPEDKLRFSPGDICEYRQGSEIRLGIVADVPYDKERLAYIESHPQAYYGLDTIDDEYVIVYPLGDKVYAEGIDSLDVFKPQFKYLPQTKAKLINALANYRTRPIRMAIEGITYEEKLKELLEGLGLEAIIHQPEWEDGIFTLDFKSLEPFSIEPFSLQVLLRQVKNQPQRVLVTLARMAGKKEKGRGFRAHELTADLYKYDKYKTYALM